MRQYCVPSMGVNLLTKNTNSLWRSISPQFIYPNMCVATILPANNHYAKLCPILAQHGYVPKDLNTVRAPERLYKYLQTKNNQFLKVMPSVKYNLNGMKINIVNIIRFPDLVCVIEGCIGLSGSIVVKSAGNQSPLAISINNSKNGINLLYAMQTKNDFLNSLNIQKYIPGGKPSLTIGSSWTDKVLMTSTSIQITIEGPSQKITAVFVPEYSEIETRFGLNLETQMGGEFSGKITYYPSHPNLTRQPEIRSNIIKTDLLIGGAVMGTVILCVFASEVLAVAGAGLLISG